MGPRTNILKMVNMKANNFNTTLTLNSHKTNRENFFHSFPKTFTFYFYYYNNSINEINQAKYWQTKDKRGRKSKTKLQNYVAHEYEIRPKEEHLFSFSLVAF